MNKIHYIEADTTEKIKQGYFDALSSGYTHYRAKGTKGYYGWNIFTNAHIAIAQDGSECQKLWGVPDYTDNVVLIVDIDKATDIAEESKPPFSDFDATAAQPSFAEKETEYLRCIAGLETALNEQTLNADAANKTMAELESRIAELDVENINLKCAIEILQSNAKAPFSIVEFLNKKVDLPQGVTLAVELKKVY